MARDEKGEYLGVRNPQDVSDVMFFPTDDLVLDAGGVDPASLPVVACPVPTVTVITPEPTAPPEEPKDSVAPVVGGPKVSTSYCLAKVETTASDNVGVNSVGLSWTGQYTSGSAAMGLVGGVWTYEVHDDGSYGLSGDITFTVTATDAAGNSSAPKAVVANVQCFG